ncbi:hypothetical protein ACL02P_03275 [Paenibacillus sp. MB22_1]
MLISLAGVILSQRNCRYLRSCGLA